MRTEIAKAVRKIFAQKVQQELGHFSLLPSRKIRAGDLLFRWEIRSDLNAYIYVFLSPKDNQDKFAIELACSAGEFPLQMARDPAVQKEGAVRFRLPQLYKDEWPKRNWEPMWEIGPHESPKEAIDRTMALIRNPESSGSRDSLLPIEEVLPLVEPQVQDAIDRIKRYGMPFFENIARESAH